MLPNAPHGDLNDPELWREIRKDPTVFKKNYWALALLAAVATLAATERTVGQEAYSFRVQQQAAKDADSLPDTFRTAKNVILFLGDGMGVSTVTAARILDGQRKGGHGEDNQLFFDGFEYTALSKTYAVNQQTADSASTTTAIMTGHKTKAYVINYDSKALHADHSSTIEFGGTAGTCGASFVSGSTLDCVLGSLVGSLIRASRSAGTSPDSKTIGWR